MNCSGIDVATGDGITLSFDQHITKIEPCEAPDGHYLAPGFIDTDMTKALGDKPRDALIAQIPLGRVGVPADVAALAAFLASDAAAYITGQVIPVDGGLSM